MNTIFWYKLIPQIILEVSLSISWLLKIQLVSSIGIVLSPFLIFEITFSIDTPDIKNKLEENDISFENDEILIQRKITAQRSVFKINSQTVNAAVVKDIASSLIDIYGQHDYRDLLNSRKHIEILDSFSSNDKFKESVTNYKNTYSEYLRLKALCESPEVDEVKREREISLLEYQINEIDAASLKDGEEEEVEEKLKIQENASRIQNILGTLNMVMYEGEGSASEQHLYGCAKPSLRNQPEEQRRHPAGYRRPGSSL